MRTIWRWLIEESKPRYLVLLLLFPLLIRAWDHSDWVLVGLAVLCYASEIVVLILMAMDREPA